MYDEYEQSKRVYKKAVKDAKCNNKCACVSRLLDAWNRRDNKRFWCCWKKVGKKTEATNLLNPNLFIDIFQNNFIDSKNNAQAFKSFNDKRIACNDNIIQFGVEEIEKAVNSLNKSQACDCNGLNLYNILCAHPAIYMSLKKLFSIMLQFSIVPEAFGHSVITPVVKNKNKSINDISNYRPISINSIICTIFEACVIVHIEPVLTLHIN